MSATYRFDPAAEAEYFDAIHYYATVADETIASRFVIEVESAIATICAAPEVWRVVKRPDVRRHLLRRFPFVFYYQYQPAENLVMLYALTHASRQPGYWQDRLSSTRE